MGLAEVFHSAGKGWDINTDLIQCPSNLHGFFWVASRSFSFYTNVHIFTHLSAPLTVDCSGVSAFLLFCLWVNVRSSTWITMILHAKAQQSHLFSVDSLYFSRLLKLHYWISVPVLSSTTEICTNMCRLISIFSLVTFSCFSLSHYWSKSVFRTSISSFLSVVCSKIVPTPYLLGLVLSWD